MQRLAPWLAFLFAVVLVVPAGALDTPKDSPKKPTPTEASPKPATYKVKRGPLKIEISLKGILEADAMSEVLLSPEAFTPDYRGQFRVLKAVDHGTAVRKGDQLVWLEMERIDQMITDLEKERDLGDLALKLAQEELQGLEKTTPIDLAFAERGKKLADEDLLRFINQDKDFLTKLIHFEVKMSADYLAYAREELHQLEKMYKANDLTEATEEIILKRQRDAVDRAAFSFKVAEYERDVGLKITLPRREEVLKESKLRQSVALDKLKSTAPLLRNQKRLTLDKMKLERERTADKLRKFKNDREQMAVKAPTDGIVYFGKCVRGHWSSSAMESKLQQGGTLMPDEVFLTIVKPRPMFVRATVEEKDFGAIRDGLKGKMVPTALPDFQLPATVDKLSTVPVSSGQFEARLVVGDLRETKLMPGMACTVKLISYQKADALVVPGQAVFTDDLDDGIHYVFVQGKDDQSTKVNVTLGKKSGARVEVLDGVREGDQLLLEKPAPVDKKKK